MILESISPAGLQKMCSCCKQSTLSVSSVKSCASYLLIYLSLTVVNSNVFSCFSFDTFTVLAFDVKCVQEEGAGSCRVCLGEGWVWLEGNARGWCSTRAGSVEGGCTERKKGLYHCSWAGTKGRTGTFPRYPLESGSRLTRSTTTSAEAAFCNCFLHTTMVWTGWCFSSPRFKSSDRQSGIIIREHRGERASNSNLDSCRCAWASVQC